MGIISGVGIKRMMLMSKIDALNFMVYCQIKYTRNIRKQKSIFLIIFMFLTTSFFLCACNINGDERKKISRSSHNPFTNNIATELQNNFFKDLFPVYELSPRTTAFLINFSLDESEDKTILDTILNKLYSHKEIYNLSKLPKGCKLYDTTGLYRLFKSDVFQQKVKQYFDKEYYIYGTRGFIKLKYQDIVIGLDECRTNFFAFCFDKSKIESVGHPLFCSTTKINLIIKDSNQLEIKLNKYLTTIPSDYDDGIKIKILGNNGKYFFTYSDDFLWGNASTFKCQFPARSVYIIDSESIKIKWASSLDLFGIPCD